MLHRDIRESSQGTELKRASEVAAPGFDRATNVFELIDNGVKEEF